MKLGPLTALICLASCVLFCACTPTETKPTATQKVKVLSTIGMIDDAVREIGGDLVEHEALMGPGIDPHVYSATAADVQKLSCAKVIFYVGLELEGRMGDILGKLKTSKAVVAIGESVDKSKLTPSTAIQGHYDPHIWFDPELWSMAVTAVRDELIRQIPDHKEEITERAATYLKTLTELDAEAATQVELVNPDQRILVTAHDAFGYFGKRYGFEVHGIQGTSTVTEAGIADMRKLSDLIVNRKIRAIFVESSVSPATIEALQKSVESKNWKVKIGGQLFSDAMGAAGTPEGTFAGMFRHNVKTIVGALK